MPGVTTSIRVDMVRNVVRERKLETDYQTWLQELRGRAYVEYREEG